MKLYFYKYTNEYEFKYWKATDESILCKDFENYQGIVMSIERNKKHEYGTRFELTYSQEHNEIMLYCQPDYDESELIGIRFCPWCGENIEFELVK